MEFRFSQIGKGEQKSYFLYSFLLSIHFNAIILRIRLTVKKLFRKIFLTVKNSQWSNELLFVLIMSKGIWKQIHQNFFFNYLKNEDDLQKQKL